MGGARCSGELYQQSNNGFAKLNELVSASGLFELGRRGAHSYVKDNRKKESD